MIKINNNNSIINKWIKYSCPIKKTDNNYSEFYKSSTYVVADQTPKSNCYAETHAKDINYIIKI